MIMWGKNNFQNYEEEEDPFKLAKEMLIKWTKADRKSVIIVFIMFTILSFFAVVDGDQCGLIIALLPIDAVCAATILLIPVSALALEKWNLSPVLLAIYHAMLFMAILLSHKYYAVTAYIQWFGVFLIVESMCIILFPLPRYRETALLSLLFGSLMLAVFVETILHIDRGTNSLYITSLSVLAAVVVVATAATVAIRLWLRKNIMQKG